GCPTATETPRMLGERVSWKCSYADVLILEAGLIPAVRDASPYLTLGRFVGRPALAALAHDNLNEISYGALVAPEKQDRRGAVEWEVGLRRVAYQREVEPSEHLLDV